MDNVYELESKGELRPERPMLVIRRKPSQVPISIDMQLMRFGAMGHLDGPNTRVAYEFYTPEALKKAEEFLQRCGWTKKI